MVGRTLGRGPGCKESTSSFAGSSQKAEAPKSACETGNSCQDGSEYSWGETGAVFTAPGCQDSGRGTYPGAGKKDSFPMHWNGGESGVQLFAGGIYWVMGASSSGCMPLSSAPSLLRSLPAGILQVGPWGPAVCQVPLAQPFGEPGCPCVPLRQQLLQGGAGPSLGRLHA